MVRLFKGVRFKCVRPVERGFDQCEVRILLNNLITFTYYLRSLFAVRALSLVYAQFHAAARMCMLCEHYRKAEALQSEEEAAGSTFVDFIQLL